MVKIALYVGAEASGGGEFRVGRPGGLAYDRASTSPSNAQGVPPAKREVKYRLMGQPSVRQGLQCAEGARPGRAAGRHGAAA